MLDLCDKPRNAVQLTTPPCRRRARGTRADIPRESFLGSPVVLALPSALIPFAGILMGLCRGVRWGLLFAPMEASTIGPTLWLHVPTILIEGDAYVVALAGCLAVVASGVRQIRRAVARVEEWSAVPGADLRRRGSTADPCGDLRGNRGQYGSCRV